MRWLCARFTGRPYHGILVYTMLGDVKYCPWCSAPLETRSLNGVERLVCSKCERVVYYNPKVTAATVVEREGRVLMVRRAMEPGHGLWSLPGGYVDRGEAVEAAAEREVLEETGLTVKVTDIVGVFSVPGDPVILIVYDSQIVAGDVKAGHEVLELDFFPTNRLPPLAFQRDSHVLEAWSLQRDGRI